MTDRTRASWLVYALGALCAGAIVAAVLVVGPAAGGQPTVTRTATASRGVVQSTVSGSGNLQATNQLNLGFKTGGTVTHVYVSQGQHVTEGQLLAALDPQSADVTLEQSKAALQSAEANLAGEEESDGASASGQSSGGSATAAAAAAHTSSAHTGAPTDGGATASHESQTPQASSDSSSTSSSSSSSATVSQATREANLASARAAVRSDQLTVQSDEQAVENTKLYAPETGTIASLAGQVGEVVSGSGTTRSSDSSSSSSGSSSGASGSGGGSASSARSGASGSSESSSSSSSSSSPFAVLSDLSSMQLVVALSESEIGNVRSGQIATVTIEALDGRKLAAHVHEVAILSTTSSGVVSYDVTFQLDQMEPGLKPGMSATAEVVVKQAEGVNVPTSAITSDTVTVVHDGAQERRRVVTGLAGNSSTIILSGLKAGETVVLPSAGGSGANIASQLKSRLSRSGLGSGGLGGSGGGALPAGSFFRGGG